MVEHLIAAGLGGGFAALFLALGMRGARRRAANATPVARPLGPVTFEIVEGGARRSDRVVRDLEDRIRRLDGVI
jgi:hypothetical protein